MCCFCRPCGTPLLLINTTGGFAADAAPPPATGCRPWRDLQFIDKCQGGSSEEGDIMIPLSDPFRARFILSWQAAAEWQGRR